MSTWVLKITELNNNSGNNGYTYKEIFSLFFIPGKCDKVPEITKSKFRRNFMRMGQVHQILHLVKTIDDNEDREDNLLYLEANPIT